MTRLFLVSARQRIPLDPGATIVLGRGRESDVAIKGRDVSRRHAEVACSAAAEVTVRDMGSTNGTMIGNRRIGSSPSALLIGQRVSFGDAEFVLDAVTAPLPAPSQSEPAADVPSPSPEAPVVEGSWAPTPEPERPTVRRPRRPSPVRPLAPPQTPVEVVQGLVDATRREGRRSPVARGEVPGLTLASFPQLLREAAGVLEIRGDRASGQVAFDHGRFEGATTDTGLQGGSAFAALLAVREGQFVLHVSDGSPEGERALRRVREGRVLTPEAARAAPRPV